MKRKIKIDPNMIENFSSLSDKIIENEINKTNEIYEVFRQQYLDWKKTLTNTIKCTNNKSILLYIMFVTVEIYIKSEVIRCCNINHFKDVIKDVHYKNENSFFKISFIGHDLYEFFRFLEKNQDKRFLKIKKLLELEKRIMLIDVYKNINNNYTSLRYNCDNNGNYLLKNEANLASNVDKERIEEVIKYVL